MAVSSFVDSQYACCRGLFHCNYCQKDITGVVRIKCAVCQDFDLCLDCFSVGVEITPHQNNHAYRVMDCLSFPLFHPDWGVGHFPFPIQLHLAQHPVVSVQLRVAWHSLFAGCSYNLRVMSCLSCSCCSLACSPLGSLPHKHQSHTMQHCLVILLETCPCHVCFLLMLTTSTHPLTFPSRIPA